MKKTINLWNDNKVKVEDLRKGEWFIYEMPDNEQIIAIKSDDTVYDGAKYICCRVKDGVMARVNKEMEVIRLKNIEISYE